MELHLPNIPNRIINIKPRPWSASEDKILKQMYADYTTNQLTFKLKRTVSSIQNRAHILGLHKTINRGRFKPNHRTWNKGKKGLCIGGVNTQFKKGHIPANTLYNGSITIRHDEGRPYIFIRIKPGNWMPLHKYIYQKFKGPVKPGNVIRFIDGNTLNCHPDNLQKFTRADNLKLNRNRQKAANTLREAYRRDRIRQAYGFPLRTNLLTKKYKRYVG